MSSTSTQATTCNRFAAILEMSSLQSLCGRRRDLCRKLPCFHGCRAPVCGARGVMVKGRAALFYSSTLLSTLFTPCYYSCPSLGRPYKPYTRSFYYLLVRWHFNFGCARCAGGGQGWPACLARFVRGACPRCARPRFTFVIPYCKRPFISRLGTGTRPLKAHERVGCITSWSVSRLWACLWARPPPGACGGRRAGR